MSLTCMLLPYIGAYLKMINHNHHIILANIHVCIEGRAVKSYFVRRYFAYGIRLGNLQKKRLTRSCWSFGGCIA